MIQAMRNPQQFLANLASNTQANQNPITQNAMNLYQKGDSKGLEQLARNLCKNKGINPDELMRQFGMK